MIQEEVNNLLKVHNLRTTDCRSEVLSLFINKDFALSHADIENNVHESFDRVTVYRTLKTFVDKGLVHKVLDDTGTTKYALCKTPCTSHHHQHEHVHFKCSLCGHTQCLEQLEVPKFSLPKGYKFTEANLLIQGICSDCNK